MSTGGGGGGEIRTKLGLDVDPFRSAIREVMGDVRRLRVEMQRSRTADLADEQRGVQRRQRSADRAHQDERRQRAEARQWWRQYQGVIRQASQTLATDFAEALRQVQREEENTIETTEEMFDVVGNSAMAFNALAKAAEIVGTVTNAFRTAQQAAEDAAGAARDYFLAMRGEASLTGAPGVTSSVLSSNLLMSLRTGMSSDDASAFVQMFESSLPAGMQKGNITREVADQFAVAAAEMLTRQGADPQTRGDLAGMVPNFMEVGSAGEGLAALEAVRVGLVEGRGFDKPLTDALLQVAGQFVNDAGTGMMPTLPELSAMIGVTSLSAGSGAAGTRVEQLVRMLQGTTAEQMSFLKGLGVESDMNIMERLEILVPQFRQLDASAAGGANLYEQLRSVGFSEEMLKNRKDQIAQSGNVYELLVSAGFSAEGLKALNELMPLFETLQQRVAKARQSISGDEVEALNRQFLESDIGQALRAEQARAASGRIVGTQEMDANTAIALGRARQADEDMNSVVRLVDIFRPILSGSGVTLDSTLGQSLRYEGEAMRVLREQIKEEGLLGEYRARMFGPDANMMGTSGMVAEFVSSMGVSNREQINAMIDLLREKGIDPFEQELRKGELVARALGDDPNLTAEEMKVLSDHMAKLGTSVDALRATLDRTYQGPVAAPQAPPGGRGR